MILMIKVAPMILANPKPTDWICADCGNEQPNFGNCEACGSTRTAARAFVESVVGPNWREKGFGKQKRTATSGMANFKKRKLNFAVKMLAPYDPLKGESTCCPRVIEYPDVKAGTMIIVDERHGKEIGSKPATTAQRISIHFDYPLFKPTTLRFKSKIGFTYQDLFRCVYEGYVKIYALQDKYDTLGNGRNYEIYGHVIDDLFLEGITEDKPGHFVLYIGS